MVLSACGRLGFEPVADDAGRQDGDPGDGPGTTCVAQLMLGPSHACARLDNGALWCWGRNDFGQLGNGEISATPVAPAQTLAGPYVWVALGLSFTCAIRSPDQGIDCWGDDTNSQLGSGGTGTSSPRPISLVGGAGAEQIAAGGYQACARIGTTWSCWGDGDGGQLGDGTAPNRRATPGPISDPVASELALALDQGCAVTPTASRCWGISTLTTRSTPQLVPGLANVIRIAAGRRHTYALLTDGTLQAWGDNSDGQLGDGTRNQRPTPQEVPDVRDVREVAVGANGLVACVRTATNLTCWGRNFDGIIGDTGGADVLSPTNVLPACL
ncbi:MAG: regulator of chromosome condensation [Deltaproteobacteria bacterium]|nr:regulator of chromosome condensation [Deltaproteobacteria bacterium]